VPEVIYQTREELYPRFGLALADTQQVYVRDDLPGCVQRFVVSHEIYHLVDKAQWWVLREIKANAYAAMRHPIGFVACVFMSLAPYRLRYYGQRIRGRVK
jgi:ubiquinone biosynthesis protein Coq4